MKKYFLLGIITLISTITLVACGNTDTKDSKNKTASVKTQKKEAKVPSFHNDTLRIEDAEIKIKKIETVKPNTAAGQKDPNLIITYSFKNKKNEPLQPLIAWDACFTATQDDGTAIYELTPGLTPDEEKYKTLSNNSIANVKPGKSLNALATYTIKYPNKPIVLTAVQGSAGKELGTKTIKLK